MDAIVHLAAADRSATTAPQALRSGIEAVLAVTAVAQEQGVRRVVLASSLGVYWDLEPCFAEDSSCLRRR
jgi:nucleoside-diphosphate-sugar epimerase